MKQASSNSLLLIIAFCGVLVVSAGVVSAGGYGLSSPDATPVPETTVEDPETGDEYTIDSFAVVDPGESLQIEVSTPSDDFDRIELRNSDNQIEDIESSGSPVEFEISSSTPPGSYSALLWDDSNRQAVLPVVVSGYDITTSHQDVAEDEEVEITVNIEPAALDDEPAGVEIVVWNGETTVREPATLDQTEDGSYTDTVSIGTMDTGSYDVYAIAQGEDQFQGEDEILAISDESTLTVGVDEDTEDDSTAGDSSGTAGGSSSTGTTDADSDNDTDILSPPPETSAPENATLLAETNATLSSDGETSVAEFTSSSSNHVIERVVFDEPDLAAELRVREFNQPPESIGSPPGEMFSTTEVSVPQEFTNNSATLRFGLTADQHDLAELSSAGSDELAVWHYNDDQWEVLPTTVVNQTDDRVTLDAETDGFSYFVITSTTEPVNDTDSQDDADDETNNTDDSVPGFGLFSVVMAMLTLLVWTVLRKQNRE